MLPRDTIIMEQNMVPVGWKKKHPQSNDHDDDNEKFYYSVYDDDDDIIMGEDDDNEYYTYEATNEDFYEEDEDDTMNRIEYNMTYTEADDDARFCQVTTNADTRQRSRPMNKVGKYRQ